MSWTLIESQTLGASAASVTLGSGGTIPQTYKTLKLVVSARTDRAGTGDDIQIIFNASTANFTLRTVMGDGTNATSNTTYIPAFPASGATASTFGSCTVDFPNYAGSTNKPVSFDEVTENNATLAYQGLTAGLWSQTAAITSIGIKSPNSANLVSGSSFTLYGLK